MVLSCRELFFKVVHHLIVCHGSYIESSLTISGHMAQLVALEAFNRRPLLPSSVHVHRVRILWRGGRVLALLVGLCLSPGTLLPLALLPWLPFFALRGRRVLRRRLLSRVCPSIKSLFSFCYSPLTIKFHCRLVPSLNRLGEGGQLHQ